MLKSDKFNRYSSWVMDVRHEYNLVPTSSWTFWMCDLAYINLSNVPHWHVFQRRSHHYVCVTLQVRSEMSIIFVCNSLECFCISCKRFQWVYNHVAGIKKGKTINPFFHLTQYEGIKSLSRKSKRTNFRFENDMTWGNVKH